MTKYNVLFLMTDQQRKDTLGCYGNPHIHTPHLDQLAAEGICFNRAYCESPICMPSRATIQTGRRAAHHGVTHHNDSMRIDEPTLAHVLAANGYRTACIGKMHLTSQQHSGTMESIADWRAGMYRDWQGPYFGYNHVRFVLGHSNSLVGHYGEWLREQHPREADRFLVENMEKLQVTSGQGVYKSVIPQHLHSSWYVGDQTIAFLEQAKREGEPFYCFASFPDPHWPIIPPEGYYDLYDGVSPLSNTPYNGEAEKDNYPRQFQSIRNGQRNAYDGAGHYMLEPSDAERIMRPYGGSISFIDRNIGRILSKLRELELEANTIVIFTTDHGEYMGAHGMMAKGGFVWEELINVPFLMKCPGLIPAGTVTPSLFSFLDIVPTLLDVLGLEQGELVPDGISQRAVLTGECSDLRKRLTVTHFGTGEAEKHPDIVSLLTSDWKLNYYAGDPNGELYHLRDDPQELNNLYHRPEAAEIQRHLTHQLLDELLLVRNRGYEQRIQGADHYGEHIMSYAKWKPEIDELRSL